MNNNVRAGRLFAAPSMLVMVAGCMHYDLPSLQASSASGTVVMTAPSAPFRQASIGRCCTLQVPSDSQKVSGEQPADSVSATHLRGDGYEIVADLVRFPIGSQGQRAATTVDGYQAFRADGQQQAGLEGFQNYLTIRLRDRPNPLTLNVTVTCRERECPIAGTVLNSVRITGQID